MDLFISEGHLKRSQNTGDLLTEICVILHANVFPKFRSIHLKLTFK